MNNNLKFTFVIDGLKIVIGNILPLLILFIIIVTIMKNFHCCSHKVRHLSIKYIKR